MGIKVANNAFGTLAASLSDVATTLSLNSGEGARFPTLGGSDYFYLTLIDTSNNVEIVKVTARSSDTMTIVRGQDGTTARSYAVNSRAELRPVAALFDTKADVAYVDAQVATKLDDVAPGTSGNVLTSNGTTWTSAAPSGGVTSLNGQTGAITNTDYGSIGSYVVAFENNYTSSLETLPNVTVSGSSLHRSSLAAQTRAGGLNGDGDGNGSVNGGRSSTATSLGLSGTWRRLTRGMNSTNALGYVLSSTNLYVRIS
jgi:hypothetical protein